MLHAVGNNPVAAEQLNRIADQIGDTHGILEHPFALLRPGVFRGVSRYYLHANIMGDRFGHRRQHGTQLRHKERLILTDKRAISVSFRGKLAMDRPWFRHGSIQISRARRYRRSRARIPTAATRAMLSRQSNCSVRPTRFPRSLRDPMRPPARARRFAPFPE